LIIFRKYVGKIQIKLKSEKSNGHEEKYTLFITRLSVSLTTKKFSDKRCKENQHQRFVLNNLLLLVPFMRFVENYLRAGQAIEENAAHAHYMLDT
jgi:hypothetical protein